VPLLGPTLNVERRDPVKQKILVDGCHRYTRVSLSPVYARESKVLCDGWLAFSAAIPPRLARDALLVIRDAKAIGTVAIDVECVLDQRDDAGRLEQDMQRLVADRARVKARLHQAQRVVSSCRTWLDRLPSGAKLEPVTASTDGKSLSEVRARISAAREELTKLMRAPVPSADLRGRVERRIADLGAPAVRGIGAGEELKIVWPGAKQTASGPDERSCEPLAMFAMLFPEKLADAAMAEVERMANDPVPRSERPARIAALEREIEELSYVAEALVEAAIARGEAVHRSASAPPQAVLGVRIAERSSRAA
jgi:hypothetical protein